MNGIRLPSLRYFYDDDDDDDNDDIERPPLNSSDDDAICDDDERFALTLCNTTQSRLSRTLRKKNILRIGENSGYQHFLLFPKCFLSF